jgi:hypothetical protein
MTASLQASHGVFVVTDISSVNKRASRKYLMRIIQEALSLVNEDDFLSDDEE